MQVKFGSIVTAGVGKLGGHQFQRGRGATQLVTKRSGHKRHKQSSTRRQLQVAELAAIWQGMSAQQRAVWADTKFLPRDRGPLNTGGEPLNGWAAFLGINTWRINFGLELITDNFSRDVLAAPFFTANTALATPTDTFFQINVQLDIDKIQGEPNQPHVYLKVAKYNVGQSLPAERNHRSLSAPFDFSGIGNPRFPYAENPILSNYFEYDYLSIVGYAIEGISAADSVYRWIGATHGKNTDLTIIQ